MSIQSQDILSLPNSFTNAVVTVVNRGAAIVLMAFLKIKRKTTQTETP